MPGAILGTHEVVDGEAAVGEPEGDGEDIEDEDWSTPDTRK